MKQSKSIWSIVLILFLLFVACGTVRCQHKFLLRDKYKGKCNLIQIYIDKKTGNTYYDSAVYCTTLVIKTRFGRKIVKHDIPYFYVRYKKDSLGNIDCNSYHFYYPNRETEFTLMWWDKIPTIPL